MKPLSAAIQRIGTENAFAVGPEIKSWEDKGFDIVKLTIGEPGSNIGDSSTEAAIKSLQNHETHYTPSQGTKSLRKKNNGSYICNSFIFCHSKCIGNDICKRADDKCS